MITYPIHELFYTLQGEGSALGLPAFFVRTFGCPLKCTFCDAAGTWHPHYVPREVSRLTPDQIADAVEESKANLVVVTGGEPAIFDLEPLIDALIGTEVHLETSGAFEIKGDFNWIVLSPKTSLHPIPSAVERADEFKLIIEKPEDIQTGIELLTATGSYARGRKSVWLHPEWSQHNNAEVLSAIVKAVKSQEHLFRAGWQVHKLYQADTFDKRSRPLVPLGGNPEKGY